MIEAGVLFAIITILTTSGLYAWRRAAGFPRRKLSLAARALVLSLIIIPLVLLSTYELMNARTFQLFGRIVPRVNTSRPIVALTFDDGPQPPYTGDLLSVLREKGAKATFFVIGGQLEEFPALGEQIVREGHELGNHSYSHHRMVFKSQAFIRGEIERTDELIRRTGYAGEIHFRSPYGKKLLLLPLYLAGVNKKNIFIDVEPDSDAKAAGGADQIVEHVLTKARPGSIILLHAENRNRAESFKAVPGIIDGLKSRGYSFVTVSELLGAEGGASSH
jgi:peptidoglycan-N-acetylglucosamine deacetylase